VDGKKDIEKLKSREERYILLGSKGYFEGIDIPGDTMTTVILDKVPNINSKEPFYKSLKEVKHSLKKAISEKRMIQKTMTLKEIEEFINEFMSLEYSKRNLKYDVNIYLVNGVYIYINSEALKLDAANRTKITQYFKDIINKMEV
jgi:hypothetical protein